MISVCIATYNGERYIKEQLDSILGQLSEGDEVIISDDGSTDRTVEIIKAYDAGNITLLENQSFKSPVFNFEHAIKHAKNEFIFLSDQDDVWREGKVEVILRHLQDHDLVISDASIIDSEGNTIDDSFFEQNGSAPGLLRNLVKNSYIGCTMAFNRKVMEQALPFPEETPMHDWWIGLTAELFGSTYFCRQQLTAYRRHESNASASAGQSPYTLLQKIRMRYVLAKNLLLRWIAS